jgi:hypothetical protein
MEFRGLEYGRFKINKILLLLHSANLTISCLEMLSPDGIGTVEPGGVFTPSTSCSVMEMTVCCRETEPNKAHIAGGRHLILVRWP